MTAFYLEASAARVSVYRAKSQSKSERRFRYFSTSKSTSPAASSRATDRSARRQVVRATSSAAEARLAPGVAQPSKLIFSFSIRATSSSRCPSISSVSLGNLSCA